jgi:hypothetical protein
MTPLMASLLRYLATAHVCDDVASADDFAELIQMLAGEVEELVHEAVPSSRPQNADGDGTDSVRIDEDEFHDVEEEAAAAARMQAIVRGRADRRRARRIKWRAQHTAVDEDEDEEFGLRRESFVIGSVMPTLTLIYQCHYVHVAALLHEDPSARLVPLLHELLAEGPVPLLLQASEPVRALLQAIAHGRGEGVHTDACGVHTDACGTQGGTQKAFMLGGLGGASDAQDGARTLRMALGPGAVLSNNDGGDGNGGGNVGGGSGGDSGSVDSAEDDPQEQLGPFMDAFFAGDHKEIEGLVNVFGAGLRASLRAVAEHARRNPHDPDPMSSTPMPEVANTRSRMTRLLGMQVLTTAPPSTPLPTGGQHPLPHETVARGGLRRGPQATQDPEAAPVLGLSRDTRSDHHAATSARGDPQGAHEPLGANGTAAAALPTGRTDHRPQVCILRGRCAS